jgi:hypothetical protein
MPPTEKLPLMDVPSRRIERRSSICGASRLGATSGLEGSGFAFENIKLAASVIDFGQLSQKDRFGQALEPI